MILSHNNCLIRESTIISLLNIYCKMEAIKERPPPHNNKLPHEQYFEAHASIKRIKQATGQNR